MFRSLTMLVAMALLTAQGCNGQPFSNSAGRCTNFSAPGTTEVTIRTGVRFRIPKDCCFLGITISSWTMMVNAGTTLQCRADSRFADWRSTRPEPFGSEAPANSAILYRIGGRYQFVPMKADPRLPSALGEVLDIVPCGNAEFVRTEKVLLVHQNDSWDAISWPHGNGFDYIVSATAKRVFVHGKDDPLYEMIDRTIGSSRG